MLLRLRTNRPPPTNWHTFLCTNLWIQYPAHDSSLQKKKKHHLFTIEKNVCAPMKSTYSNRGLVQASSELPSREGYDGRGQSDRLTNNQGPDNVHARQATGRPGPKDASERDLYGLPLFRFSWVLHLNSCTCTTKPNAAGPVARH